MPQQLTAGDLFTEEDFNKAIDIYNATETSKERTDRLEEEVIKPIIGRINAATGQQNSTRYFAYWLESMMLQIASEDRQAARSGSTTTRH
jgi:hypothetical protein